MTKQNKNILKELHKVEYARKKVAKKRRRLLIELKSLNELFRFKPELLEKEALKKVYSVRSQRAGKVIKCRLNLPLCFYNKKVKLKIVGIQMEKETK